MIGKFDPNNRLVLKSPAVHPCESISPSTLISSLINLSQNITDFNSKPFPTHKKIIREVIRQIEILQIFLEEVQENISKLTNSFILCLSDFHFTLQNMIFLLEDCSRENAKLYILMKSQFIANQFRSLVRSLATTLDIVPFYSLDFLSDEVKELVEMLMKQAQKTKLEIDTNDECAMRRVMTIMNQLENGFEPERGLIKRVLNYLNIRDWEGCNNEVEFLVNEMSYVDEKNREISLFYNLMGFLCYCRGVIFVRFDKNDNEIEPRLSNEKLKLMSYEDFRCPISLELMVDPVIVSTGQTYDRSSIEKWLKEGNLLCPKTGEILTSLELIPNLSLKSVIQRFCLDNGVLMSKRGGKDRGLSKKIVSFSVVCREAMSFLAQFLAGRLRYGTYEQKNNAAYEVKLLAKDVSTVSMLIEVGIVVRLLELLTSCDQDIQENAIAALLKLSKHSNGRKEIVKQGGLMILILVLRKGLKMEIREMVAAIIFYLSSVDKYRKMIGSTRVAIPALVELVKEGTMCGKKNSLAAIFALLLCRDNHQRAVDADVVTVLVDQMSSGEISDLAVDSLAVLASLSESVNGCIAILQGSCLSMITGLVKSSCDQTVREYCVSILLSLCINGGVEVVAVLAREIVLMASLYSVVINGSSKGSKKARTLISMLQKLHESSSSDFAAASSVRKERILHAI